MTDKRFWLVSLEYDGEQRFVRDNYLIGEKSMSNQEVVNLLNEQHETIERLKQNVEELLSVNVEEELLKENEQLKERNDFLRKQLDRVCIDNETMGDKLKQIGRIL